MATSSELRRGGSHLATGLNSDIGIGPTITAETFAAELAKYPDVQPFTMAYNRIYRYSQTAPGALCATLDYDGKWYKPDGTEVT